MGSQSSKEDSSACYGSVDLGAVLSEKSTLRGLQSVSDRKGWKQEADLPSVFGCEHQSKMIKKNSKEA